MAGSFTPFLALALCLGAASAQAQIKVSLASVPKRIAMESFFKNPEKVGFRISPDGQYISYRAPWHNRMNIFVQKVGEGKATQVTTDTIRDVGGYFWKGDRILPAG